jgi:hypothetical protein
LAHERVLQALIAYMARTEPRFVDHLRERFVEPIKMARHEHDHRDSDDYAEEFIRAVMLLGEVRPAKRSETSMVVKPVRPARAKGMERPEPHRPMERVQLRERNGIWEVKVDGVFRGDYHKKEHALAAAALLNLSL